MKEAILLQYLTEFLSQDKYGEIVEGYNIKKSSKDILKLTVTFDLSKMKAPTPIKEELEEPAKGGITEQLKNEIKEYEKEVYTEHGIYPLNQFKDDKPEEFVEEEPEEEEVVEEVPEIPIQETPIAKAYEGLLKEEEKKEKEKKAKEEPTLIKSIKDIPTITSDLDGNVVIGNKPKTETNTTTPSILSNGKSLYKDHYFSNDEVTYLNAYLNHEITGSEGAELLGLKKPSDFYNLAQRFKRSKNISTTKKKRQMPSMRVGQKMTDEDLGVAYDTVKKGAAKLADMARQFGGATSTMSIRMHKYIQVNNLEPLFPNGKEPTTIPSSGTVEVASGTEDGWQIASDEKFHFVEDGEVTF